jgi:hypothetical protein
MCNRHSFCLTRAGKILDGCGLAESHTTIMQMHGLSAKEHDTCNLYEWQPPTGWPVANYAEGLRVDKSTFTTTARNESAIERHLRSRYPTANAWKTSDPIRWDELPLPNADRIRRAYELSLRAQPLGYVDNATVLEHVNRHLSTLGCKTRATSVVNADSVWASVRASVRDSVWDSVRASVWDSVRDSVRASVRASVWDSVRASVWDSVRDSVWASVRDSVWDSVRDSVDCSMVREDSENPWLPLSELATYGVYLYGVTDDGTAYVWRKEPDVKS